MQALFAVAIATEDHSHIDGIDGLHAAPGRQVSGCQRIAAVMGVNPVHSIAAVQDVDARNAGFGLRIEVFPVVGRPIGGAGIAMPKQLLLDIEVGADGLND